MSHVQLLPFPLSESELSSDCHRHQEELYPYLAKVYRQIGDDMLLFDDVLPLRSLIDAITYAQQITQNFGFMVVIVGSGRLYASYNHSSAGLCVRLFSPPPLGMFEEMR